MYAAPSTVAPLLLALVLCVSGVAKALDLSTAGEAFVSLRLPRVLLRLRAPVLLPFGELALAVLLLVCSGPLAVLVAVAATVLFVAYLVVIVRALTFDERVTCSCFGKLGLGSVDRFTAGRNAVLVALAVLTVLDAARGRSVVGRLRDFDGPSWLWLVGVLAGVVLTWLVAGHRGEAPSGPPVAAADGDYPRAPIPLGRLRRPDNSAVTLRSLASTEAVLLLYVSPTCGSCVTVIEKARTWQRETSLVHTYLALPMPPTDDIVGLQRPEDFDVLFDPESELFTLFESATPTAVLLGADGRMAGGPVVGPAAIAELMDDALRQLEGGDEPAEPAAPVAPVAADPADEESAPRSPTSPVEAEVDDAPPPEDELDYVRRPTPYGLLSRRDGSPVPLLSLADTGPVVLLMVSPTCGSCRDVIVAAAGWQEKLPGIPVSFVVTDETAADMLDALVPDSALTVYLDRTGSLVHTFLVGTPSMVALGPDRYLLAGPVAGSTSVAEAMEEIITEVAGLQDPA